MYNCFRRHANREDSKGCECSVPVNRSLLKQQGFLIASNDTGCHLAKIGTGYDHTKQGQVYAKSSHCLEPGLFAQILDGCLIHRPFNYDKQNEKFGQIIDSDTLLHSSTGTLLCPPELLITRAEVRTIGLFSSNNHLIWFRLLTSDAETFNYLPQAYISFLDFCTVSHGEIHLVRRKLLLKNPESPENIQNI